MREERGVDGVTLQKPKKLPWSLILVFFFLTAAISVSGYIYYQKQKKAVVLEQTGQLQAITDLKADEIERWLQEKQGDARLIMENPMLTGELLAYLRDRSAGPRQESIRKWMTSLRDNFHYQNVVLLDASRETVLALAGQHPVMDDQGPDVLEAVSRRKNIILSDLHRSAAVGFPHLDIALPLLAEDRVSGFVLLRLDAADYLFPLIQSWPTPSPSAETLLVRREGDDVLFLNELRHRRGTAIKLRLPLKQTDLPAARAVAGKTGVAAGKDYRGIAVWSVSKLITGTPWFIVSKIDREEIERPIRSNALAIFLVALFLILCAALVILFIWQRQAARFSLSQLDAHQASEEKFKQVFETANVGKSMTQLTGEIQVNKAFCDMLGYGQEELQKKKWQELTPADEIEAVQKMLEPLLDGRENSVRFNKHYMHKNGSLVWGDVSVAIRRDPAGKPLHFITTVVDISERKRAEETIRESAALLRSVLDATPFPIAIVDVQDDQIEFWSRSAIALFGHTAPTTAAWYGLAYPDPAYRRELIERWKPFLEEAQRSGQAVNTGEYRVTCRDGSVRICELYAAFLTDRLIVTFNDITKRKQAETELKTLSVRNQAMLEAVPDIIMEVDNNKVYTWANHAGIEFFGNDAIGQPANHYFEGEQQTYLQVKPIFNGQEDVIYVESWQRRRDGQKRLLAWWCRVLKDVNGQVSGALSSARDITEIKLAENEVRRRAGELAALNLLGQKVSKTLSLDAVVKEAVDEIIKVVQPDTAFLFLHESEKLTLAGSGPINAANKFSEMPEHRVGECLCGLAVAHGKPLFSRDIHSDQRCTWDECKKAGFRSFAALPLYSGTEIIGVVGLASRAERNFELQTEFMETLASQIASGIRNAQLHEQVQHHAAELEQRVQERTAELSDLYNNAPCGYHSLDSEGFFAHINDTELRWLGYTREEIINKMKFSDLLTAESVASFQVNFPVFKERGWISDLEFEMKRKDGSILPVLLSATAVSNAQGQFVMSRSTLIDYSEQLRSRDVIHESQKRLVAANKELEAFSYSVSHDLRAPLRAIDGFSRIVVEEYADKLDDEGRRLLGIVRTNTGKMGRLIDDLLAFSRLSRQQMAFAPLDLAALAGSVFQELKSQEKGRRFKFKVGALPVAHGDFGMLRQVLQNLLANAIKFTRTKPMAAIELSGKAGTTENTYMVKDNGVGFDMSYSDKLFGVFQRLHDNTEFEGTGVGLAIVQRIVLRHGGRVWGESGIGGGATFYFSLPTEANPEMAEPPTQS